MAKKYVLRLYIADSSAISQRAIKELKALLEEKLPSVHELDVIDVTEDMERAEEDRIVVTPAVVRAFPLPVRKIVGSLSDKEKVVEALELIGEGEE